jgi:hypothetical protein
MQMWHAADDMEIIDFHKKIRGTAKLEELSKQLEI